MAVVVENMDQKLTQEAPESSQQYILVVDDEPNNIRVLASALEPLARILVATDGNSALSLARSRQPDLILLDIMMPKIDGYEVLRQLKADPATCDIPVIFSTAKRTLEDETTGLKLGAADYVTKPLSLPIVTARVKTQLENRRLYKQLYSQNVELDHAVTQTEQALKTEEANRKIAEDRFIFLAFHDQLTGFPNRTKLGQCIIDQLARYAKHSEQFALAMISLDSFHEINNTLGHHNGDKFLSQVSKTIHELISDDQNVIALESRDDTDFKLAHVEGVVFAALLKYSGTEDRLAHFSRKLLNRMDEPFDFMGMSLDLRASIGFSTAPDHGDSVEKLMQRGHVALEEARMTHKRATLYSEEINPYSQRRLTLMGELRNAISNNDLELFYQPQVCLKTHTIEGVEALLRWQHPKLGFVPPDEFIPLAEETGVIKPLTRWVVARSLEQSAAFRAQGMALKMAINLSAKNLREAHLLHFIRDNAEALDIPPNDIILEVTESAMMEDPENALNVLNRLVDAGFQLAIDDFGTGYSSLAYLKKLPVRELKIDRSFVMDMLNQHDDEVIVQTTISLSKNLGLLVVAEGVENQETLEKLEGFGCDTAQGYHITRPLPADKLIEWIKTAPYPPNKL